MHRSLLLVLAFLLPSLAWAQSAQINTAQEYLQRNAKTFGITGSALAEAVVTDAYTSQKSGTTHLYFQQHRGGIEVVDARVTVNVGRDGRVLFARGSFVRELEARARTSSPSLSAETAAQAAAERVGLDLTAPLAAQQRRGGAARATTLSDGGVARLPIMTRLVYQPVGDDLQMAEVRLAWDVEIHEARRPHVWSLRVDAATGEILAEHDLVVHDTWPTPHASAPTLFAEPVFSGERGVAGGPQYNVFDTPVESPNHGDRSLVADPAHPTASPDGWHDDGDATYTITRGNNAYAYEDRDDNDAPGYSPDGGAALDFDFGLDLGLSPLDNRDAAITNLFYWNNLIHDVFYLYGFDEAAGNFQATNGSGDGFGTDAVQAEAQDGADICGSPFGCLNNANFYTPPDGGCGPLGCVPRMQMYEWDSSNPRRDGDFDNGIIVHEYGHGISNRLTGGPAADECLRNQEQMGEGWSDWFGLAMTIKPGDVGETGRGIGTYALNQPLSGPGIRTHRYSTDLSINPHTYADIASEFPPHGVGSVWSVMLWDMTWNLIEAYGLDPDLHNGNGGNNIALQLVTEGMKMQPCSPGFVDGRDAIVAADSALYDGANAVYIWEAFARRGLGWSASQGSSGSTSDGSEGYDLPPGLGRFLQMDVTPDPVPNVEFLDVTLNFSNGTAREPLSDVVLSASIPEDALYVGGSASDGGIVSGGQIVFPAFDAATGSETIRTFRLLATAEGSTTVFFTDDMESGGDNWIATHGTGSFDWEYGDDNGEGGSAGWFAEDVNTNSDQYLALAEALALTDEAELRFTHLYNTESSWDGGVVEISTNGGTTWTDLGSTITENGYNGTLNSSSNPIGGRPAFQGNSNGFVTTVADLSDYAGEDVLIRFRFGSDSSVGSDGWYVDNVQITTAPAAVNVEACAPDTETDCAERRVLVLDPIAPAPEVTVSEDEVGVALPSGGTTSVEITVGNEGDRTLDWQIGTLLEIPAAWLEAFPVAGQIEPGESQTLTLTFDASDIGSDQAYQETLAVYANDPERPTTELSVSLFVGTVANEDGPLPGPYRLSELFPNPSADRVRFDLEVAEAQFVTVAVFDMMGREVARLHDGLLAPSTRHGFALDGASLASGVYLVRVTGEAFAETRRVTLLK